MQFTTAALSLLSLVSASHGADVQIPLSAPNSQALSAMPLLGFGTSGFRASSTMPLLGFGLWNVATGNATEIVSTALLTGYRHLDCAAIYGNQKEVGRGIAHGLAQAGLKREDIWVTSKLWNDHHLPDQVEEALNTTLRDLGLDYLDLWLIHFPVADVDGKHVIYYTKTWAAMVSLLATGKVRHIGVSNFDPSQLKHLIEATGTKPSFHQFELHPYLQQRKWVQWHKEQGINVTAYSPFANTNPRYSPDHPSKDDPPLLLKNKVVTDIASARGCTPAQAVLAWGIHRGTSVIPKSAHAERIKENFESLECVLQEEDFEAIDALGDKYVKRYNNPSKGWGVDLYKGLDGA